MNIQAYQKLTLLDYPGKVASTVFTQGCNFRCPFCHNPDLVNSKGTESFIDEDEFFSFLKKRVGLLDGVCISGGEPLIQPDIASFAFKIKELGFLLKLDTNGTFPEKLKELIYAGLLDYVAMDIKSSPEGYSKLTGIKTDIERIRDSAELLMNSDIDHEFRTTAVKNLHSIDDFREIGRWLRGEKKYFIQSFVDSGNILGSGCDAFSKEEMAKILNAVREFIPTAEIRGTIE